MSHLHVFHWAFIQYFCPKPAEMINTDIYLHFDGQCEEAFQFYQTIFGGEFITAQRYGDMPGSDKMNDANRKRMMHISLKITPATTLMGSDIPSDDDRNFQPGTNFHICLQAETEKEANKLFQLLAKDGKVEMPMNKTFWGAYFGMAEDKFGIHWMISFQQPK
jgi:PhnB protein